MAMLVYRRVCVSFMGGVHGDFRASKLCGNHYRTGKWVYIDDYDYTRLFNRATGITCVTTIIHDGTLHGNPLLGQLGFSWHLRFSRILLEIDELAQLEKTTQAI